MPFVVELFFDRTTEETIRDLWRELASPMLMQGSRPHLSVASCATLNLPGFREELKRFAGETTRFPVNLASLGCFLTPECVLYLAPTVTPSLLRLHERLLSCLQPWSSPVSQYDLPGTWVPHCTLTLRVPSDQLIAVMARCHQECTAIVGQIEEIGVVELTQSGIIPCFSFPLAVLKDSEP